MASGVPGALPVQGEPTAGFRFVVEVMGRDKKVQIKKRLEEPLLLSEKFTSYILACIGEKKSCQKPASHADYDVAWYYYDAVGCNNETNQDTEK